MYIIPQQRVTVVQNVHQDWSEQYVILDNSPGVTTTAFVGLEMAVPIPRRQNCSKLTIIADYYVNKKQKQI
jgi:hypothetical protein